MNERIIDLAGVATVKSVKELTGSDALAYLWGLPVREEIVRCKDCMHYDPIIHACRRLDSLCGGFVSYVFDDGFCAWGERRDS